MSVGTDQMQPPTVPFAHASVADAMSRSVIQCAPETPLRTVAQMMAMNHIHAVYVFGGGVHEPVELWGLVSDLDVAAAACGDIDERTAGSSAVTPLVTVASDQTLAAAAELMSLKGTTHLAVLDPRTQRPVGVVSTLDIARAVAAGQSARA